VYIVKVASYPFYFEDGFVAADFADKWPETVASRPEKIDWVHTTVESALLEAAQVFGKDPEA
jgi:hypothetical protein